MDDAVAFRMTDYDSAIEAQDRNDDPGPLIVRKTKPAWPP
jgi:hypothetical protein